MAETTISQTDLFDNYVHHKRLILLKLRKLSLWGAKKEQQTVSVYISNGNPSPDSSA